MPDSVGVAPSTPVPVRPSAANGGFPEPWAGAPVQLIRATHEACGGTTLVRLPPEVPSRAVRVVVCGTCQESFEVDEVEQVGALAPQTRRARPKPKPKPTSRSLLEGRWSLLAVPVALAAVVGGLLLIQGGGGSTSTIVNAGPPDRGTGAGADARPPAAGPAKPSPNAILVRGSSYTVALPAGWVRTEPPNGATFAARAADGTGDATLWVQRDPSLSYNAFVKRSLARLRLLAGSAHVIDRVPGPTAGGTIVRLEADAPPGKPAYDVTLRVAGPYRYYLATTLEPDASAQALNGVELIDNSLTPTAGGGSKP